MATETLNKESALAVSYFEGKIAFEVGPVELKMSKEKGEQIQIIDLRTAEHFAKGHIPGAENVLYDQLDAHLPKLNKDITTVVYCYDELCHLGAKGALYLAKKGYKVRELVGGFDGWVQKDFQVEGKADKGSCSSSCSG